MPSRIPARPLRCRRCGREAPATPADLLRFSFTAWPKCCGEPMAVRGRPRAKRRA